jgi:hypothetical protein
MVMTMRLLKTWHYRRLVVLLALCALAVFVWVFAANPVLLEVGTRFAILNPFRSRAPERTADVFLLAASRGKCSPDLSEDLCKFVTKRPLPATEWRLVNRWDSARDIKLFYRLRGEWDERGPNDRCLIAEVYVKRTGATWNTFGYGVQPGPCNGRWRP